jgi:hypothetical protein
VTEQLREVIAAIRSHLWLFLAIYSLPVCSAVVSSMLYRPDMGLVLAMVMALAVLVALFQTLSTGRSDNHGKMTFRSENPGRFWAHVTFMIVAYIFVTLWPIGYALQEAQKQSAMPNFSAPAPNPPKP